MQIGCSHAGAKGVLWLCLADNMALYLSAGRSRARKFKLLRILRIIASWTLAFGVSLSVRWVPSEYKTSGEPPRGEETLGEQPHRVSAVTSASHQVQCSPRVNSLIAVTPSPLLSSSMISKRRNANIFTSYGQFGGPSTCRGEDSCANSSDGCQKQEKASTNSEHSLRHEKGGRIDPDTKLAKR